MHLICPRCVTILWCRAERTSGFLNSVAKIPYHWALDGISNTQTINPDALGHETEERKNNLVQILDGYFTQDAHHLNVNVFGTEKLIDAMEHPEKEISELYYPCFRLCCEIYLLDKETAA
ncbi:MAG: glycine radical domain-containing protein [Coprococcus comes]